MMMYNKIIIECPECGSVVDIYGRESCPRCGAVVDADYADILTDVEEDDDPEVVDDDDVDYGFRCPEEEDGDPEWEDPEECPEYLEEVLEDLPSAEGFDYATRHKEALSRLYEDPEDRGCRINGRQMK